MAPRPYRVLRKRRETSDTITLALQPVEGSSPRFAAGQFSMLYAPGVGEAPISISGDPSRLDVLVHTVRAVGTVTTALCRAKPRDLVGVRGPFGNGWPVAEAAGSDVVVAAGGIGLAPLRPVIYALLTHRERYGRIAILYGARTPRDLVFLRDLHRWRGRFDLEVETTVDSAPEGWWGNVGVLTTLIPHARFEPSSTVAFVCGPEIMMRFTARELEARGVEPENIFISMERNMKCGIGLCGHCQRGRIFVCKDGPVLRYDQVAPLMAVREV